MTRRSRRTYTSYNSGLLTLTTDVIDSVNYAANLHLQERAQDHQQTSYATESWSATNNYHRRRTYADVISTKDCMSLLPVLIFVRRRQFTGNWKEWFMARLLCIAACRVTLVCGMVQRLTC